MPMNMSEELWLKRVGQSLWICETFCLKRLATLMFFWDFSC
jgi:hypothetical protein